MWPQSLAALVLSPLTSHFSVLQASKQSLGKPLCWGNPRGSSEGPEGNPGGLRGVGLDMACGWLSPGRRKTMVSERGKPAAFDSCFSLGSQGQVSLLVWAGREC